MWSPNASKIGNHDGRTAGDVRHSFVEGLVDLSFHRLFLPRFVKDSGLIPRNGVFGQVLDNILADVSEEEQARISSSNAASLYNFD